MYGSSYSSSCRRFRIVFKQWCSTALSKIVIRLACKSHFARAIYFSSNLTSVFAFCFLVHYSFSVLTPDAVPGADGPSLLDLDLFSLLVRNFYWISVGLRLLPPLSVFICILFPFWFLGYAPPGLTEHVISRICWQTFEACVEEYYWIEFSSVYGSMCVSSHSGYADCSNTSHGIIWPCKWR